MDSAATLSLPVEAPMTPAAERILSAAGTLFYRHGIRAVGVESIAEAAGTTKKTIYDRFGSKDGLIVAYLHRRSLRWRTLVLEFIADKSVGGEQSLAVFDATDHWMASWGRGCGFINAYAELGGTEHPGVPIIVEEKTWVRDLFEYTCAAADYPNPAFLAGQLTLLHEGSIVARTAGAQRDAADIARRTAQVLLGVDDRMAA
ncbi:TetR/AcrR family transcriptional regulator [Williamsia sp. 1135]|uniref:TetR/AcrR family transcriptional regulator n=1 Tax=Williamsia sp. 1135 TaxID=1889262 RepID=UPI000A0F9798|nr:TetR/AcrR family transcriptional regulator [Williamsia sp. 1135]ORM28801.1 TetR family transcriptional regulator [Williamsia sp. 1135]